MNVQSVGSGFTLEIQPINVSRNTVLPFFSVGFYLVASVFYTTDPPWNLISPWMWKLVVCRCCFLLLWSRFTSLRILKETTIPVGQKSAIQFLVFYSGSLT